MLTLETIRMRDVARAAYDIAVKAFMECDGRTTHNTFLARAAQMHGTHAWHAAAELLGAPDLSPARRDAYESLCLAEVNNAMNAANTAIVIASSSIGDSEDQLERLANIAHDSYLNVSLAPSIVFTIRQSNRVKKLLAQQ